MNVQVLSELKSQMGGGLTLAGGLQVRKHGDIFCLKIMSTEDVTSISKQGSLFSGFLTSH